MSSRCGRAGSRATDATIGRLRGLRAGGPTRADRAALMPVRGRTLRRDRISRIGGAVVLALVLALGCAGPGGRRPETVRPIRVSDAVGLGDPARRASTRLTVQGLDDDAAGSLERARGSYERAIQVDATNPYAYLALARHYLDGASPRIGDAERATLLIDQAAALFEAEGMREPRVGVHLMGLRGLAMYATGNDADAALYLDRARELAPEVWGDGYLSAEELR